MAIGKRSSNISRAMITIKNPRNTPWSSGAAAAHRFAEFRISPPAISA
jgi:hypothetical protein